MGRIERCLADIKGRWRAKKEEKRQLLSLEVRSPGRKSWEEKMTSRLREGYAARMLKKRYPELEDREVIQTRDMERSGTWPEILED